MNILLANGTLTHIPVQIDGVPMGYARIDDQGRTELVMGEQSELARELKEKLAAGLLYGLELKGLTGDEW
jgi:hypothetical protein